MRCQTSILLGLFALIDEISKQTMMKILFLFLSLSCWTAFGNEDPSTILSSYCVTTNVTSRLAQTSIVMELDNLEKCSKIYALTLQLPLNAQLTDLEMELSDGCELTSQVKTHTTATDDFNQQASQGKPAVLLTTWDIINYQLQVSLPPNGTTLVELRY
jgi:hypothetical protein